MRVLHIVGLSLITILHTTGCSVDLTGSATVNGTVNITNDSKSQSSEETIQQQSTGNQSQCVESGLLARLDFEEGSGGNVHNTSVLGAAHDGNLNGGVSWTQGKYGSGVSLDGSTGFISLGDDNFFNSDHVTLSLWVSPTSNLGTTYALIQKFKNPCPCGFSMWLASGHIRSAINIDSAQFIEAPATSLGWNHLAVTYDGSRQKTYINGEIRHDSAVVNPGAIAHAQTSQDLLIGKKGDNTHYFSGKIDQVKIYNRALSASEILTNYQLCQE